MIETRSQTQESIVLKKTTLIAMLLGTLAAPVAWTQDEPYSDDEQMQAGEEFVSEGDEAGEAEFTDEWAADDSGDAGFDESDAGSDESVGNEAEASEVDALLDMADSEDSASDLIDDQSLADETGALATAADPVTSNPVSDRRPTTPAPSVPEVVANPEPAPAPASAAPATTRAPASTTGEEPPRCFDKLQKAFDDRGANAAADGTHTVIISYFQGGGSYCIAGAAVVENGTIFSVSTQYDDNKFELMLKKFANSSKQPPTIVNGISEMIYSADGEEFKVIFIDQLKNKQKVLTPVSLPEDL
jgi:hypothetical protein